MWSQAINRINSFVSISTLLIFVKRRGWEFIILDFYLFNIFVSFKVRTILFFANILHQ